MFQERCLLDNIFLLLWTTSQWNFEYSAFWKQCNLFDKFGYPLTKFRTLLYAEFKNARITEEEDGSTGKIQCIMKRMELFKYPFQGLIVNRSVHSWTDLSVRSRNSSPWTASYPIWSDPKVQISQPIKAIRCNLTPQARLLVSHPTNMGQNLC